MTPTCTSDLLIIGGGPAGLSAAINGASEGLVVRLLDNGAILGGQAKESSAIENYPGFVEPITGADLMGRMAQQAHKFASSVIAPVTAQGLEKNHDGSITVLCDDYSEYTSRAVLITTGVSYRRLLAENIGHFMGKGVFYGVPSFKPARHVRTAAVVGGANSAGQAALGLAANKGIAVKLLSRSPLEKGMSTYLIDRIKATPNIEVIDACEVTTCAGDHCLTCITVKQDGRERQIDVEQLNIFIGAMPRTLWLRGTLALDEGNFIKTGHSYVNGFQEPRAYYETSMAGVFAAGDVRSGSIKRIASGVGEGAGALQMIHTYLSRV